MWGQKALGFHKKNTYHSFSVDEQKTLERHWSKMSLQVCLVEMFRNGHDCLNMSYLVEKLLIEGTIE